MTVLAQVLALKQKTREELAQLWGTLYDTPPPKYSRAILENRLAYRIQELAYGSLSSSSAARLERLAGPIRRGGGLSSRPVYSVSTLFVREYKGVKHEALVVGEKAIVYEGKEYPSLTKIARFITGGNWSGPVFFSKKSRGTGKKKKA